MFASIKQITALVLSSTTLTLAFSKISVPSTITADVSAQIKLTTSSFDAQFDSYRVYLAMTPPGWGTGPACYLVNSSSTSIVDFNVAIPASVGPAGSKYYSISIKEFNSNPNAESSSSGFSYSSNFNFVGGTGSWSTYETTGHSVSDADTLPCSAYACARNCSQAYYPADVADTDDETAYKAAYECVGRCPGVVQESWGELVSQTVTTQGVVGGTSSVTLSAASKTASGVTATGTGSAAQSTVTSSGSRTSSGTGTSAANVASPTTSSSTTTPTNASVQVKAGYMLAFLAGVFALVL